MNLSRPNAASGEGPEPRSDDKQAPAPAAEPAPPAEPTPAERRAENYLLGF
jgi:hypothetical protein